MTSRVRNELYSYKNQPIYELYLGVYNFWCLVFISTRGWETPKMGILGTLGSELLCGPKVQ